MTTFGDLPPEVRREVQEWPFIMVDGVWRLANLAAD
jgi:hypothetical protein